MGKYFALEQGFEKDVANSVSDHYLQRNYNRRAKKLHLSHFISIVDKIDLNELVFLSLMKNLLVQKECVCLRRPQTEKKRILKKINYQQNQRFN